MKKTTLPALLFFLVSFIFCLEYLNANIVSESQISGIVKEGYRLLTVPQNTDTVEYTVYRGDYLKFILEDKKLQEPTLSVPDLAINKKLTKDLQVAPYFKMKKTGTYAFSIGKTSGKINVIEYEEAQYQALSVGETAQLISNINPLILDVRTTFEYANGHLQNSTLIPVQQIQQRLSELSDYKDEHILIYCATGNRSTVAAKILIDNGFTRIYNMREGFHVWAQQGFPVAY